MQKEYDAKKSEIRQATDKKTQTEDAVLETMGALEEKTAAIAAVEKQWDDAQAEFAQSQVDAKARIERLRVEQAEAKAALAKAEAEIPDKHRQLYFHLTKAWGPDALAAVKDKNCQGCRTAVSQQRLLELYSGMFILCQSCGKMLYPAE